MILIEMKLNNQVVKKWLCLQRNDSFKQGNSTEVVAKNGGINGRFLVRWKTRPRLVPLTGRPVENIFEENKKQKGLDIFSYL